MEKTIPPGFLTVQEAGATLVIAKLGGLPDRPHVRELRQRGVDVADGGAIDEAVSEIWAAVTTGKLQAFVVSARDPRPQELTIAMVTQIPGLRSPRGRDFRFLRQRNPHMEKFVAWFGCNVDVIDLIAVFRSDKIVQLARAMLRRRRAARGNKPGRPSRKSEVKARIRDAVDDGQWSPLKSIKNLTAQVNARDNSLRVSADTVARALKELHAQTGDRRLARLQRQASVRTAP